MTSLKTVLRTMPHIERTWADKVILELRLRDATGAKIGDTLAEVESHLAESGEGVWEAFGDPQEFAASIEVPAVSKSGFGSAFATTFCSILIGLGAFSLVQGIFDLVRGFGVVSVPILGITVGLMVAVTLLLMIKPVMRFVVDHPWVVFLVMIAFMFMIALASVAWSEPSISIPAPWTLVAAIVFLTVGIAWARRGRDNVRLPA